jgi:hypothetical protein
MHTISTQSLLTAMQELVVPRSIPTEGGGGAAALDAGAADAKEGDGRVPVDGVGLHIAGTLSGGATNSL